MFGKKLEIKIDKMPAINQSGKIDMRGKEMPWRQRLPIYQTLTGF